jgi:hypothetical protein
MNGTSLKLKESLVKNVRGLELEFRIDTCKD